MVRALLGEIWISFDAELTSIAFFVLSRLDVQFSNPRNDGERVSLKIPLYRKRSCVKALNDAGIEVRVEKVTGLPSVMISYRHRIGIPLGAVLCCVMIALSCRVIWCVDVTGNKNVPDKVIVELLDDLGCGLGDKYGDIDFDMLHNRFLMECHEISWIAVNMNGTHANVEVRESENANTDKDNGTYNIVASEDGTVVRVAAKEGKPVVEINDTVKAGELLISAAISYKDTFNRFENANGSVFARVKRSFEVNVPLEGEKKVPTGRKIVKKSLTFFDFDINLFTNSRISYELCDKITVNRQMSLFGTVVLPLFVKKTEYSEYELSKVRLTEEEARNEALVRYREKLADTLGTAELLSKTVSETFEDDIYTVKCELYCLADIGIRKPVIITGKNDTSEK